MSTSIPKGWDLDLAVGLAFEKDDVRRLLTESGLIECKVDLKAYRTGNVFIEYEYRGQPSGLAITEAAFWAIGLLNAEGTIETIVFVSVPRLKDLCRPFLKTSHDLAGGDHHRTRGIKLPMFELLNLDK